MRDLWDEPGTHQYGRPARCYQQLQALNLEDAWSRVRQPTLVVRGEYDIAMQRSDHERIVELVNTAQPGAARLVVVPQMDHSLFVHPSLQAAFRDPGGGGFAESVAREVDNVVEGDIRPGQVKRLRLSHHA